MTPEGWAVLWIGAINVVWACIFVGVLVFALRTDTEAGHRRNGGDDGPEREPQPPHAPEPRPRRRRLRGAERAAARRRRAVGTTYYPRQYR